MPDGGVIAWEPDRLGYSMALEQWEMDVPDTQFT